MFKALKAEWLKEKKCRQIVLLNLSVLTTFVLLFVWGTFLTGQSLRQISLQIPGKAGAYGLVIFVTIFRKLWGILYGYFIIDLELKENRSDFSIQNTSRRKLLGCKMIYSGIISLIIIILFYVIPYSISAIVSSTIQNDISFINVIYQIFLVWLITYGNILIGMLAALIIKDTMLVVVIIFGLEYFSSLFPEMILNIWEKIDGYWYVSNLFEPLKKQLDDLNNFVFLLSDSFTNYAGLFIWVGCTILTIGVSFYIFEKRDF